MPVAIPYNCRQFISRVRDLRRRERGLYALPGQRQFEPPENPVEVQPLVDRRVAVLAAIVERHGIMASLFLPDEHEQEASGPFVGLEESSAPVSPSVPFVPLKETNASPPSCNEAWADSPDGGSAFDVPADFVFEF